MIKILNEKDIFPTKYYTPVQKRKKNHIIIEKDNLKYIIQKLDSELNTNKTSSFLEMCFKYK